MMVHRDTMIQLPLRIQQLLTGAIFHSKQLRTINRELKPLLDEMSKSHYDLVQQLIWELEDIISDD